MRPNSLKLLWKLCLLFAILGIMSLDTFSSSFIVSSHEEFEKAQTLIKPLDSIVWKKGKYTDVKLNLTAKGIYFLGEEPGSAVFSGASSLTVKGDSNIVSGFQFVGGMIEGDVVDIFGSYNTIEHLNIQSYDSHYYLRVRPNSQYNKIVNCNFESKPETQESSVVQIEATEHLPGYHVVSHCSFKNHTAPPDAGGDFGIEALRIGYSYQRTFISRTIVEYCYFEKCNGDYEVISNKACENILRYNTFMNNGPAHLTLRHGSRAMVYGNFFINGAGLRIKEGQNHAVVNNYFDTGDHFSINLQNHHFDQVDTVIVANNTFINHNSLVLGGAGEFQPKNVIFTNNLFAYKYDSVFTDPTGYETWTNNVMQDGLVKMKLEGISSVPFDFKKNNDGLSFPAFAHDGLNQYKKAYVQIFNIPELDDDFLIKKDIMRQERAKMNADVPGCFLPQGAALKYHATIQNTGPVYLR